MIALQQWICFEIRRFQLCQVFRFWSLLFLLLCWTNVFLFCCCWISPSSIQILVKQKFINCFWCIIISIGPSSHQSTLSEPFLWLTPPRKIQSEVIIACCDYSKNKHETRPCQYYKQNKNFFCDSPRLWVGARYKKELPSSKLRNSTTHHILPRWMAPLLTTSFLLYQRCRVKYC